MSHSRSPGRGDEVGAARLCLTRAAAAQTDAGGTFSVPQIERFRCSSAGNPAAAVDMSCNTTQYNQDWNPDNEVAVTVDPENPTTFSRDRTTTSTGSTTPPGHAKPSCRPGSSPRSTAAPRGSTGRSRCERQRSRGSVTRVRRQARLAMMAQLENRGGPAVPSVAGRRLGEPFDRRRRHWRGRHRVPGARRRIGMRTTRCSSTRSG